MAAAKSITKVPIILLLVPVVLVVGLVALPLLCAHGFFRWIEGIYIRRQLHAQWPAGKVGLLVYSQSPLWTSAIERELLPHIASACIVVNRTIEPRWKEIFRLECRAQKHWAGSLTHNPVVLLIPPRGKVLSFQLFNAFQEHKRGDGTQLETSLGSIREAFAPYIAT
jgi:hypothetical protein